MKNPESILVVTLSNIGDVILTTPVMAALRLKFPDAKMTVVVGPKAKPVLEKSGDISRIIVYDKKATLPGKVAFLRELWKDRYDMVVDLRNTAIPFLVFARRRSPLFRAYTKINMRERHLEVLRMAGISNGTKGEETFFSGNTRLPNFQFFSSADELSVFSKLGSIGVQGKSGWILVAPGAASERKRWPPELFREVVRNLVLRTRKDVFLVGSRDERPIAEVVARGMPASVKILSGETSLSETAFLVSKASLVISNDSAIMHLGFEIKTPTVGIFGPTDHEKYGHVHPSFRIARENPTQCHCNSHRLPYAERSCFHGLTPEKVLCLCNELLNRDTPAARPS